MGEDASASGERTAEAASAGAGGRDAATLAAGLARGERRALARAITLIESRRPDHRLAARALLSALPPPARPTLRRSRGKVRPRAAAPAPILIAR